MTSPPPPKHRLSLQSDGPTQQSPTPQAQAQAQTQQQQQQNNNTGITPAKRLYSRITPTLLCQNFIATSAPFHLTDATPKNDSDTQQFVIKSKNK